MTKDYYKALNVSSSATADELRKAFRKLALLYHPDKNKAPYAQEAFREIKEAYEVLRDPVKRADYNYRRYASGARQTGKPLAQSPAEILHAAAQLAARVSGLDPFRINPDLLSFGIRDILSEHNLAILLECGDRDIKQQVTDHLLGVLKLLPFPVAASCMVPLQKIAADDPVLQKQLGTFTTAAKWQYLWNRFKIYIALLAAILFAIVLALSGK